MSAERLERLRSKMIEQGLDAMLVTSRQNVRYITGFSGSNGVAVVRGDLSALVTDGRYKEQASGEAPGWEIDIYTRDITEDIREHLAGAASAGIEDSTSIAFQAKLVEALPGIELRPTSGIVEQLRAIKEPREIDAIRASVECTAKAWESLLPMIQPGVTERQLGAALDYRMMSAGADKPAFDTIVASGPNSAMPHATTTNRALQAGDLVVIDFGARKDGYCCDITQTVGIDKVDSKATAVLDAVVEAWEAGFAAAAPGMPVAEVDKAARDKLVHAGYGEAFTHSLGHGVGLEVHEKPSISRFSDERIEVGMVFTIEPGVYLDGELGVRHERTVLMAPDGPVVL